MYGERLGKDAPTNRYPPRRFILCRFSIFYRGCKQPKSVHMLNLRAKVQRKVEWIVLCGKKIYSEGRISRRGIMTKSLSCMCG